MCFSISTLALPLMIFLTLSANSKGCIIEHQNSSESDENRIQEVLNTGSIKVGACQMLTSEDVVESTEKVIEKIREAAQKGVQILSFPEGTLFGYCCRVDYWENAQLKWFQKAESEISEILTSESVPGELQNQEVT